MKRVAVMLMIVGSLGGAAANAAETALPILDVAAVPSLKPPGRTSYGDFLLMNLPRAFAVGSDGAFGWYGGGTTIEDVRDKAMKSCAGKGAADCAIYAEDLQVVWHGRPPVALPAVPGPLIETPDHAFVPDARFIWRGPQAARGVFVWAHGKSGQGQDLRSEQPQAYVRAFNNAGFDVVRFTRQPAADYVDDAADWLSKGLAALRQKGWRMVIAGGQSRGAWNGLQALDAPGLADAVIAVSPASFSGQATQEADLSRILRGIRATSARVAVAQFKGDIYVRDMPGRVETERALLPSHVAASLVIDQPEGITGHGGGNSADFARRFGPCLLHFVTDPTPQTDCR